MSVKQQWLHYITTLNQTSFMKLVFRIWTALAVFSIPGRLPELYLWKMSHRKVRVFSKTQLCDTERGREKESGRKSISLHRRWWKDAPPRVIKTMKIQQRVTDRGLFALVGTARCLSAWPVARLPQSSGIFQASLISTNKAMGLFSVSHQPRFAQLDPNHRAAI